MYRTSNFFREIADFCRFFFRTPIKKKEIIFYSEHEGYYPYFEGVIAELTEKYSRNLCYITSDFNDPIFEKQTEKINAFYLDKLLAVFMLFVNCRVFVITLTDLNQFHLKRSYNPVQYVYIFHSLASTHMKFREGSYDHYDYILCPGPYHMKEIRRREELAGLKSKKLLEGGYYRLERIYAAYQKYLSAKDLSSEEKTMVLIAPSWGDSNLLESCGERLTDILLKAGFAVIMRPHPETTKRSPELIASLVFKFGSNPHFILEKSVATDDSLIRADCLICDYSGVALEYAFGTEKPVISIDVPVAAKNPNYKELGLEPLEVSIRSEIGEVVVPDKLDMVPKVISRLIAHTDTNRQRIAQLRNESIYAFGQSSDIAARCITDILTGKG